MTERTMDKLPSTIEDPICFITSSFPPSGTRKEVDATVLSAEGERKGGARKMGGNCKGVCG